MGFSSGETEALDFREKVCIIEMGRGISGHSILDEHMPLKEVPRYLQRKGHSSQHAVSLGHVQRDDAFHYQFARAKKRILITRDDDFADPRKYPYRKHPGVIILAVGRSRDSSPGRPVR